MLTANYEKIRNIPETKCVLQFAHAYVNHNKLTGTCRWMLNDDTIILTVTINLLR